MSYYTDLDEQLGMEEMAEEDMRQHDWERTQKERSLTRSAKAEAAKQFKAHGINKNPSVANGMKVEVKCRCCNKPFQVRKADVKRGWGKYCSKSCKAKRQPYNGWAHYRGGV